MTSTTTATDQDLLLSLFSDSETVRAWSEAARPEANIKLHGTMGAELAYLVAGYYATNQSTLCIICPDKEAAGYLYHDIAQVMPENRVHLLVDSFKRPGAFDRYESGHAMLRTELVNRLIDTDTPLVIVTYPEALMEKVVSREAISGTRISVKVGELLDIDTIIDVLLDFGFERTDFVHAPSQFSIRGGIIDVFSYGNAWPYRIELFDDEVEQIRLFDPMDQRSVESINRFEIIPNVNQNFSSADRVSMLDILPEDVMMVFTDMQDSLVRWDSIYEKMGQARSEARLMPEPDQDVLSVLDAGNLVDAAAFLSGIGTYAKTYIKDPHGDITWTSEIQCDSSPQPEFNRKFSLLIDDLQALNQEDYRVYLYAENPKQIERFYTIFKDMEAVVEFMPVPKSLSAGFIRHDLKVAVYTDHQIIKRFHRYRLKRGFTKTASVNLRMLRELRPGDLVTHIDHGIGKFSGLEKIDIAGQVQDSVRLLYHNNDVLYVSIHSLHKIARYTGKDGAAPRLSKLGSDTWTKTKNKTKKKIKDIASDLIKLYARRKAADGYAFPPDGYLQHELEASFIYEDTPDQLTASNDMKADMQAEHPMDRLICGDVGFGKTEIAIRGAFKAVVGGKQVAVLVPTTILALQHYHTFSERLKPFGVTVDYINRFRSSAEKRKIGEQLSEGKIDVVIGTHGLLNKQIKFADLGLLVIDEEQKFGVAAKEKLRNLKVNVDTLTLTATPIPRTLQFSLLSARDMSILRTPPPNRRPIHTEVRLFHEDLIYDAIEFEIDRGGQVFFVHNRVKSLPDIATMLKKIDGDMDIRMAHGQMDADKLEQTLVDFIDHKFDVLLCTNIIETGLDIPNANTIIINNAHQFGMSDLHQLRGRVGRSNRKAFCYLFAPPLSTLTSEARKRLKTLEDFSELGSGFHIAMRDLDIRGAGNLLGAEQSGFVTDLGYETYQKILAEAMAELKESTYRDLFAEEQSKVTNYVHDVAIDVDIEMHLPNDYVANTQERLNLYMQIDQIEDEAGIDQMVSTLEDRFGKLPDVAKPLFDTLRARWLCRRLGFSRMIYKKGALRLYFIEKAQSPYYDSAVFQQVMSYVNSFGKSKGWEIKERNKRLLIYLPDVASLEEVSAMMGGMLVED